MKVILPDGKELELAPGASGLDAARAIGPKLAEQAVLVKVDDEPRDLRLPLPDGARSELLQRRSCVRARDSASRAARAADKSDRGGHSAAAAQERSASRSATE